jgi:serine phosphatase RsbU (regulator of sigma subunit)
MPPWIQPTPRALRRAWGRVRWKIAAIIVFTGASTILVAGLAVAALNVVVRRESANIVEKQIQVLLQASRPIASALLENAGSCTVPPSNSAGLKSLLAYTDEVFPQAQASLVVDGAAGMQLRGPSRVLGEPVGWLPPTNFAGLVVDRGELEIRNVVTRTMGGCKGTAIFSLPLGPELAKRLSSAAGLQVTPVSPRPFHVRSRRQRLLRTAEGNFVPGMSQSAAVVLTVRNWETGSLEDWIVYSVRLSYSATFEDVARLGSHVANWVLLGAVLALIVLFMDAAGVWMCIRLGANIAATVDELSAAALQIAGGNLAWRTPVRSKDQLGDLSCRFNEMATALERLHKEEAAALRIESELQVARNVQEYLFPRAAPVVCGATVSGRTLAARSVGGDLYDFFELGGGRTGILCADVSGKGIPAALMMANLQAVARARLGDRIDSAGAAPDEFVGMLNQQLTGRFGDNRYATLFWAEYNPETSVLTYVNAGHPAAILVTSEGDVERLDSDGFPVGMFANARYAAKMLRLQPGSRLIVFSDGLTDAQNAAEEEFGEERLIACCRAIAPGIEADGVAGSLMQAVADWSAGTEQFDDTTVVVIEVAEAQARHQCHDVVTTRSSFAT